MLRNLKSDFLKNSIYYTSMYLFKVIYILIGCFTKVKCKRIAVFNYNGKGFGDNPKYVVNKLLELDDSLEIIWMVKNRNVHVPKNVRAVKLFSFEGFYYCNTSKIWISNARLHLYLRKKAKQKYFQLWHGGCGPKRIEKAAGDKLIKWYVSAAKNDSKMADYMISNSKLNTKMFKKDFWYSGAILEYGSPRHDILKQNKEICDKKVHDYFGLNDDIVVAVYAPTFHKDSNMKRYFWDYEKFLKALNEKTLKKWVLVVRLHPNMSEYSANFNYSKDILNGTDYDDMQELICSAELVITDFSGVMMQAALAEKMVYLITEGEKKYNEERGLLFSLESTPFFKASNGNDLATIINLESNEEYQKQLKKWLDGFGFFDDGRASERVAQKIISEINK